MSPVQRKSEHDRKPKGEDGFMLVGLIVAIFLILLALTVAAPKVARGLRREREVEAIHRGNQYVRALRLYYKKIGHYPGSMDQLEKTNNIRFLRQQYIDPLTGKADWKLIHLGEAKTTVKGFFGQPLAGMTAGLGSAAGMASPGIGGNSTPGGSSLGSSSSFGSSSPGGSGGLGGSSLPTLGGSTNGTSNGPGGSTGASPNSGTSGQGLGSTGNTNSTLGSAAGIASSGTPSGGAPFVGVGIPKDGDSITILNEQTTYDAWEFLYDPRIEQLYAKGSLFGGSSNLGSAAGNSSGFGNTPGSGTAPSSPGFGNTPGFGSTPGTNPPAPPTAPPQPPQ